jgi:hypothetical protein
MPILPSRRKLKGTGSSRNHFHTRPLIPMGVEEEWRIFMIPGPRYRGFVVEPVLAQLPPESGFDPKVQ